MEDMRLLYDLVASAEALNAVVAWIDQHGIGLRRESDRLWHVCYNLRVVSTSQDWEETHATLTQAVMAILKAVAHRLWKGEVMP